MSCQLILSVASKNTCIAKKNVRCFRPRSVTHSIYDNNNNNYGAVAIVKKRLILVRYSLSQGAVLGGSCALMSTHFDFWYCKHYVRMLFIERWYVQILYKNQCYSCFEFFMDFHILCHLNIFDSDNKQLVSVYIGRLPVVNI